MKPSIECPKINFDDTIGWSFTACFYKRNITLSYCQDFLPLDKLGWYFSDHLIDDGLKDEDRKLITILLMWKN